MKQQYITPLTFTFDIEMDCTFCNISNPEKNVFERTRIEKVNDDIELDLNHPFTFRGDNNGGEGMND